MRSILTCAIFGTALMSAAEATESASAPATPAAEAKAPKFCEKGLAKDSTSLIEFKFGNGEVLSMDVSELSEEMILALAVHGALQKIGDSYASAAGDFGFGVGQARRVITQLQNNEFNASRAGQGGPSKDLRLVFQALAELAKISEEDAQTKYESADEAGQKALRTHPQIKAKVAAYKAAAAAEAAAKVETPFALPV